MTALTPLLAADAPFAGNVAQQRADFRNNMFVMATLYCERGSSPVRIRNMSRGGALIESGIVPPVGSEVRLSRGSLSVSGRVVWQSDNRAGIQFSAAIAVSDWLPGGNRPTGQQRVDEMIHVCRTAAAPNPEVPPSALVTAAEACRQLLELSDLLNIAAGELASDLAIATGHPTALQSIDIAAQKIEKLASLLGGGN